MNGFKGTNASKHVLNPSVAGHQREIEDLRTSKPANVFLRAVATHILCDPLLLSTEEKQIIKQSISNPEYLDGAPRNAIICRIITDGADKRGNAPIICYPFFSSHFELPVKSGEQVWIIYDNPTLEGSLAYWLSRIPEGRNVEDANYTHGDRKFLRSASPTTSEKVNNSSSTKPSFPNGGGTSTSTSLKGLGDYESIIKEDKSFSDFVPEDVPRYNKRPGELVLQGSNNTLISLGDNRVSTSHILNPQKSGRIDIVVGRLHAGQVVENSRGFNETDKSNDNNSEGNINLADDAARLTLTQTSNSDIDFNLKFPAPVQGHDIVSKTTSHGIIKANEVRVLSRSDGSIRLIKDGDIDNNYSSILLLSDGTAQIDGEVIFLGRVGGEGPGPNGFEPYIKFSKYKSHLTTIVTQVNSVLSALITSFPVPVAAPGTPHPGLTATLPSLNSAVAELNKLIASLDEAASTRVYGE